MTIPIHRSDLNSLVEDYERRILALERAPSQHPVGSLTLYASATPPAGWLTCDGSAISRTTYSTLFSVIGTTYGAGDGSATFNLPDLRGRVAMGLSGAHPLASSGGEDTHTLSVSEMPTHSHVDTGHSHGVSDPTHAHNVPSGSGAGTAAFVQDSVNPGTSLHATTANATGISISNASAAIQNAGLSGAHNNLQPYLALSYIIRY